MRKFNKFISMVLVIAMVLTFSPFSSVASAEDYSNKTDVTVTPINADDVAADLTLDREMEKIYSEEDSSYSDDDTVRAIIVLNEKPVIEYEKSMSMLTTSRAAQSAMTRIENEQESVQTVIEREVLDGRELDVEYKYSYTVNAIAASLTYKELKEIRNLKDVKYAVVSAQYHLYPMTADSSEMIGAQDIWAKGYDGTGMRIAVIDSGIDTDHPSFAGSGINLGDSNSYLTKEEVERVLPQTQANIRGNNNNPLDVYLSEKIPFGYNYIDRNTEVNHTYIIGGPNSHGSHVSGIAAANKVDGTDVIGVAPKAQIMAMRVFGINGGAYTVDIIAAMEDALLLNADVINLSLGSNSGFTTDDKVMIDVLERASQTDTIVCIASGNNTTSSLGNTRGTDTPLTESPDNGVTGSPASYGDAMSVASIDNTVMVSKYIQTGDDKISYTDSSKPITSFDRIADKATKYVIIGNPETGEGIYGYKEDFPVGNFSDSVAVVSRGEITFAEKHKYAAEAGFAGIIIYNNKAGVFGANVEGSGADIAVATVSAKGGAKIIENSTYDTGLGIYLGQLNICITAEKIPSETAWELSSFSSWGTTPDLKIKPEISGVGGNVYSAVDGGKYGVNSGTSMATPQVAGMGALVLEYLKEEYPDMSQVDRRVIAQSLLMSTATIVKSNIEEDVPYSPRAQGAGLGNVLNAVTSKAYLSVEGSEKPKIELGDDKAKSGVYNFSFDVNNMGEESLDYTLKSYVVTEDHYTGPDGLEYMAQAPRALNPSVEYKVKTSHVDLSLDFSKDNIVDTKDVWMLYKAVKAGASGSSEWKVADFNKDSIINEADVQMFISEVNRSAEYEISENDGTQITIPSGGAQVEVTVTLNDEDRAYMDSIFENGIYVEGFVQLIAVENESSPVAVDLNVPFLAFYGDWTASPMFDNTYAADLSTYSEREMDYPSILWASKSIIGLNPFADDAEYIPERSNVISPEGSKKVITDYYLPLLRNARTLTTSILDKDGQILWDETLGFVRKSCYEAEQGMIMPISWEFEHSSYVEFWPTAGADTEDGSQVTFKVTGELDYGDKVQQNNQLNEWSVQLRVDETAPTLNEESIDFTYKPLEGENGKKILSFNVKDESYVAAVLILNSSGTKVLQRYALNQAEPGVETKVTFDVSDIRSKLKVAVGDYGSNLSYYDIDFNISGEGGEFDNTKLFGYRLGSPNRDPLAWVNFDTDDYTKPTIVRDDTQTLGQYYAAEYYDNYVYAMDRRNNFYALPFEGLGKERIKIASFNFSIGDMAYDYSSNVLLGLADSGADASGKNFMSVVVLDNKDYIPNKDYEVAFKIARPANRPDKDSPLYLLTMACTTNGELYGIGDSVPVVDENGQPVIYPSTGKQVLKSGELYYLGKYSDIKNNLGQTVHAEFVMDTGYNPNSIQSMTYDHNTGKLYWAKSGGTALNFAGNMVEIDLNEKTVKDLGRTDAQISSLFVPYEHKPVVTDPVTMIKIEQGDVLNIKVGATQELTLQIIPWTADKGVIWTSEDTSIVTVDENGKITGVGDGVAKITATAKTNPLISDSIMVAVKELDVQLGGYMVARDPSETERIKAMYGWGSISTKEIKAIESGAVSQAIGAGTVIGNEIYGFSNVSYDFTARAMKGTYIRYDMQGNQISDVPTQIIYTGTKSGEKLTDVTYSSENSTIAMSFSKRIVVAKTTGSAIDASTTGAAIDASGFVNTDLSTFTGVWNTSSYAIIAMTFGKTGDILYCIDNLGNLYKAQLNLDLGTVVSLEKVGNIGISVGNYYGGITMNSMCYNNMNDMLYLTTNGGTGVATASIKLNAIDPDTATAFFLGQSKEVISFGAMYIAE